MNRPFGIFCQSTRTQFSSLSRSGSVSTMEPGDAPGLKNLSSGGGVSSFLSCMLGLTVPIRLVLKLVMAGHRAGVIGAGVGVAGVGVAAAGDWHRLAANRLSRSGVTSSANSPVVGKPQAMRILLNR